MLCMDIKFVSRLRGISSGAASSTHQATTASSSTASPAEKSKSRKARRESGEDVSVVVSDSEEDSLLPDLSDQEMIRRNRSRSVCVATILPSTQLRQLHRRASHYVYVASAVAEDTRS